MIAADAFRDQPVLVGEHVRLEPLTASVLDEYLAILAEPEVQRRTGSHGDAGREQVAAWLASRGEHHDRADWAAVRVSDGALLGEAVVNDFDADNASANYRILLGGAYQGQGHGTEITRLVVGYALDVAGLHRLSLGVFDFNLGARHVYEKCGFVLEGRLRDALRWDGKWHDELIMSVLRTDPRVTNVPL